MRSPEDDGSADFAALAELAEVFTTLVGEFTQRHSHSLGSADIVALASRCMPSAEHIGLTVVEHGQPRTVAASSELPDRLDRIRAETGEGPALDVLEVNDMVTSGDLAGDERWPRFGPTACDELGVRSVASYRLYLGPSHRAALSFLSWWPHAFDELALTTGAIFAAYCSLTLFTEVVLLDELTPRRAAEVHREIGVAAGILVAGDGISIDEAYRRLHGASRRLRQSLHETARGVVEGRGAPRAAGVGDPPGA